MEKNNPHTPSARRAQTFVLQGESATRRLAEHIAEHLVAGAVVHLSGPLGAGKTACARYLIRALRRRPANQSRRRNDDAHEAIPSPSYTLVQNYELGNGLTLLHADLWRVQGADDAASLSLHEALEQGAILLIEWPEHGKQAVPEPDLRINLDFPENGRETSSAEKTPGDTSETLRTAEISGPLAANPKSALLRKLRDQFQA